ncbi:hypothetical protein OCV99_16705 [Dorea acetigenes]|uniref:Uncharacterized protein n=1 Tax=Dorea acetigenes TaxID=2981787 RepID=A0ABT2RRW2_9FIRM|nr:hypothetical protein [Dorea acetigenes]MCB6415537.1 hypothetical protein [Faecalimonas umbilicata]MCU6688142.1 hypothetical protein [Dorea acetigenes]SCJ66928.1 Uncharacterised protein [uncultured Clostridium sp.]
MSKLKIIAGAVAGIVCLAGAVCLGVFTWRDYQTQQEQAAGREEAEKLLRPLDVEWNRIQQEIDDLEEEYSLKMEGTGTAEVLFTHPDARVYEEAYPIMEEYGYTGVLAVSEQQFPGTEGNMSLEQFQELIQAGWSTCIVWSGDDMYTWLGALALKMQETGVPGSSVMYFPSETYLKEYDEILLAHGFAAAVHHGEAGEMDTAAGEGGIWHPAAVGLQGETPKYRLDDAVKNKANIVYTVGWQQEDEMYNEKMFRSMLSYFKQYQEESGLQVMDIAGAGEYRQQLENDKGAIEQEYLQKKEELERQKEDIERQMDEIGK